VSINEDFFELYFQYVGRTESPAIFHRWTAISMISTLLSRNVHLPFGHGEIFPNQYILLTGGPGTRKGTAIKIGIKLMERIGYDKFSPNKAAKETLWHIMANQHNKDDEDSGDIFDLNEPCFTDPVSDMYIAQDEFIDFIGVGNDELLTNLTNLWDNLSEFSNPKLTKEDAIVSKPTINILSGATPGGISEAFGSIAMSGGFFSRVMFIYGGATGTKIAWPDAKNPELEKELITRLKVIQSLQGEVTIAPEVKELLAKIYTGFPGLEDRRFAYYCQRRQTHLLKLSVVCAAARGKLEVIEEDCIRANTIMHLAELRMPQALGEFGKARLSDVSNDILEILSNSNTPLNFKQLWKHLRQDLAKPADLQELLSNLIQADRIQTAVVKNNKAFLPVLRSDNKWEPRHIDYSMVRPSEHPEAIEPDKVVAV